MSQLATQPPFILCSACPAHSHHGFLDSQRGMSDEPESSPGHDPFQALPSAHLLLPVSLPATFRVEGWGQLLAVCPHHLRHCPSALPSPHWPPGELWSDTRKCFFFPTRNFYQECHVARSHFPWEQRSAGQRVWREGNARAWAKSGWGTSPFCPDAVPGTIHHRCLAALVWQPVPKDVSIYSGIKLGFHILEMVVHIVPCQCPADPVAVLAPSSLPGVTTLPQPEPVFFLVSRSPRILWLGSSTLGISSRLPSPSFPGSPHSTTLPPSFPAPSPQSWCPFFLSQSLPGCALGLA